MDQCISRLERMGQKKSVNAYILTIKNTIESKMMKLLEWKLNNINVILNDNQSLKQGEEPMAKKKTQYLEEKVDLLLESVDSLTEKIEALSKQIDERTGVSVTATSEPKEAVEKPAVTEDEVRGLAAKITKADSVNGKNICIEIIEKIAGAGKKLKDCDQEQLQAIAVSFEEVLDD